VTGFLHKIVSVFRSEKLNADHLLKKISICGEGFVSDGPLLVTEPRELIIGKNVRVGKNAEFYCEGGLIICDNVIIGKNVKIYSNRSKKRYSYLDSADTTETIIIPPGTNIPDYSVLFPDNIDQFPVRESKQTDGKRGENLFFVVSTGRSGSNAFAKIISSVEGVNCGHERFFLFNRLSTQYAHKEISKERMRDILKSIFIDCTLFPLPSVLYGDSDQKLANLVPLLHEIIPAAKFIWLLRNGTDFVSSSYGRGWFDQYEYSFSDDRIFSADTIVGKSIFDEYRLEYSLFRLHGAKCGAISDHKWNTMGSFDRNCWYWSYWNNLIEEGFALIPAHLQDKIKLEEMNTQTSRILSFLGNKQGHAEVSVHNKATYELHPYSKWSADQVNSFKEFCSEEMKRWYPQNIS
jgi:hypothetical protein